MQVTGPSTTITIYVWKVNADTILEYPGYEFMRVRISEDEVQISSQVQHNVLDYVHILESKKRVKENRDHCPEGIDCPTLIRD